MKMDIARLAQFATRTAGLAARPIRACECLAKKSKKCAKMYAKKAGSLAVEQLVKSSKKNRTCSNVVLVVAHRSREVDRLNDGKLVKPIDQLLLLLKLNRKLLSFKNLAN